MTAAAATLEQTLANAREKLRAARTHAAHWEGELSSSALSTATAVCALAMLDRVTQQGRPSPLVRAGAAWLCANQNADGGWGDTCDSPSNISTTTLAWAALGMRGPDATECKATIERAEAWLRTRTGDLTPAALARTIAPIYGEDRTFSAPILTLCALAGRFGAGRDAWGHVPPLPFELAALPRNWFAALGLPVVSYALPALIAIGQAHHHHCPTRNPVLRVLRAITRGRTLHVLRAIQPTSGGYLEATPLTSFVVLSLAGSGHAEHPVAEHGRRFLEASARPDGSWPIDTDLATWLTTLSIDAFAGGGRLGENLTARDRARLRDWLLAQQFRRPHAYTGAAPGGWAWTNLSGGVPDADDTAGALLALYHLTSCDTPAAPPPDIRQAAKAGTAWLLGLQNRDGGIPTFCRGWGRLPFDRSTPDLTAHALRAWQAWQPYLPVATQRRLQRATPRALQYLLNAQQADGSWIPLWFGNQGCPDQASPLYGTARVLRVGRGAAQNTAHHDAWPDAHQRGVNWLLDAQNTDGGWGGGATIRSSIEETALAVEALADGSAREDPRVVAALDRGCQWLIERTRGGTHFEPAPIGLYFAKLWYAEQLYPLIFTVAALERVSGARHAR